MRQYYGQCHDRPFVILHGGAGPRDPERGELRDATEALAAIARTVIGAWSAEADPRDVAVAGLEGMEQDPRFNAGLGSALQKDGSARLTAALMDSEAAVFSGVISATHVKHPSRLVRSLQDEDSRVVGPPGVELWARRLGCAVDDLVTEKRLREWSEKAAKGCDTVGCVVRAGDGRLAVGTSTGGRGMEWPGRVSDSGTVAGNYASSYAAVSATGIGEEIVDDALAARLETRCRDGMTLADASRRCFSEGSDRDRQYGWIAAAGDGGWAAAHLTKSMAFVVMDAQGRVLAASVDV